MAWAPDYVTTAELRAFLRVNDSDDDTQLAVAIAAASRAIDQHTGRQFGVVGSAEERFYTAVWDRHLCRWLVDVDDLMSTSGLVVEIDGTATTTYTKEPRNAAAKGRPWTSLVFDTDSTTLPTGDRDEIAVTALWGWSAVPTPVKQACYLQASRFHARRDSPYGVAGSPEQGNELRLLARVDPDVAVSLGPYIRRWAVV
jgi:uncharacterized phiE125 gp8 family phage protein